MTRNSLILRGINSTFALLRRPGGIFVREEGFSRGLESAGERVGAITHPLRGERFRRTRAAPEMYRGACFPARSSRFNRGEGKKKNWAGRDISIRRSS